MSEDTPEGMFNIKPEPEVFDPETPMIIFPIIDIFIRIPKPPKPIPNIGKIMKKFELDSRSRLHEAMTTNRFSANPTESDSA